MSARWRLPAAPAGAPTDDHTQVSRPDSTQLLRLGAAAGAATMAATSTGDLLVVGVLLGLVAGDAVIGAVGVVAAMATLARWSSSSLTAVAGGQAVLGAAGWTGPAALVVSSWAAAAAVILVSPHGRPPVLAFGLVAAGIVAGPALGDGSVADVVVRLAASAGGVAAAWLAARAVPRRQAHLVGAALAVFALFLVVAPATTAR